MNECAGYAGVAIREVMNVGVLLVIDCHRGEAQRAALLGLADAKQFCPCVGPIDS